VRKTATVLVIEDEADIRFLIRKVLQANGIAAIEASNGPQGLELLRSGELPDLVLLDVQMPSVDGWDTLAAIREDPETKDLPVVMCTVKGDTKSKIRGLELGCDGYVTKPFDMWELTAQVQATLARSVQERMRLRKAVLDQELSELEAAS
jgi:DNA-binding response OmpR family regulator